MTRIHSQNAICLTDDLDFDYEDRRTLLISPHSDGWIIDSVLEGTSNKHPVLFRHNGQLPLAAIYLEDAYHCILHKTDPTNYPKRTNYMDLAAELDCWQKTYKNVLPDLEVPTFTPYSRDNTCTISTDEDKPDPSRSFLKIIFGGNGDWYISTMSKDDIDIRAVRFAMSGGASWKYPGLSSSISFLYRAINKPEYYEKAFPSYIELKNAVDLWRSTYPNKFFDIFYIADCPTYD